MENREEGRGECDLIKNIYDIDCYNMEQNIDL